MTRTPAARQLVTGARTLGVVAVVLVCLGCTAPAAQVSQVPLATPAATPSPDASSPQPSTQPIADGLVVRLDGAGEAGQVHLLTVFADGRVLIARPDGRGGMSPPVERRLTAAGVELVRDELAATGLTDTSATYMPVPNPGVEPPGFGGAGPSLEVGLPDGGTAVITWYLFADIDQDYFQPQPEAEALDALAARLSSLEDWLPADAWVDGTSDAAPVAFEVPEGFLPPNSIVRVVVDRLQLREEPGLAAPVEGAALKGDEFFVAGWFGPVRLDGIDWYRLGPEQAGDVDAWAAAGSGADRYLEVVPPDCPAADPDLTTVISMGPDWHRLACFGDGPLTLEGTYGCAGCGGTTVGDFEPMWLAYPMTGYLLHADYPGGGSLQMRVAPDSGLEIPANGSIVRVTGHYSDTASATCTMTTFDGELATPVDPRTAELYCREQFVVDSFEVIGTDPDFP